MGAGVAVKVLSEGGVLPPAHLEAADALLDAEAGGVDDHVELVVDTVLCSDSLG